MGAVGNGRIDKKVCIEPFAHKTAVMVGKAHNHGFYLFGFGQLFELIEGEKPWRHAFLLLSGGHWS